MIEIKMFPLFGEFAENKERGQEIRLKEIIPALDRGEEVVLDFDRVELTTQSFIHVLISDLFREYGNEVLEKIAFRSCNKTVKTVISIVVEYMQESLG